MIPLSSSCYIRYWQQEKVPDNKIVYCCLNICSFFCWILWDKYQNCQGWWTNTSKWMPCVIRIFETLIRKAYWDQLWTQGSCHMTIGGDLSQSYYV